MPYNKKNTKTQKRHKLRSHAPATNKITRKIIKGGGVREILNKILRRGSYNLTKDYVPILATQDQIDLYNNYLNCVEITSTSEKDKNESSDDIKKFIIGKTFNNPNNLANIMNKIKQALPYGGPQLEQPTNKWVDCIKECQTILSKAINTELNSTAFMLRILSMSLVNDVSAIPPEHRNNPCYNSFGGKIRFEIIGLHDYSELTGIWDTGDKNKPSDKNHIKMIIKYPTQQQGKGRLIMGFGPSASGKTYCAAKVIQLMQNVETNFPSVFLAIDGGLYREKSLIYQAIIQAISDKKQYTGLSNLVEPGAFGESLFESGIIKKAITEYLETQKTTQAINLYVPETLGSCQSKLDVIAPCNEKYEKYISLTEDDNWIGLMIYQHETPEKCFYDKKYKCVGTTASGTSRAQKEGKEYSSDAWFISYTNGNAEIEKAPKYRFRIHNSGMKGKPSIFEDLSKTTILTPSELHETSTDNNNNTSKITDFLRETNWVYIPGKVKKFSDCSEYVESDEITKICERKTNWEILRKMTRKATRRMTMTKKKPQEFASVVNQAMERTRTQKNTNTNTNKNTQIKSPNPQIKSPTFVNRGAQRQYHTIKTENGAQETYV